MPTLQTRGAGTTLTYRQGDEHYANPIETVSTTPYTLTGANNREVIECTGSASVIDLDAVATVAATLQSTDTGSEKVRFEVVIKNTLSTDITISANGSETINGSTDDITLIEQESIVLCLNDAGTAWYTITKGSPKRPDEVGRNLIINGNFDVWQRGTNFTSGTSNWTADRWQYVSDHSGGTVATSQQSFTVGQTDVPGEPKYFIRHNWSAAGSGATYSDLRTKLEDVRTLAGQVVTLSFYAKADSARNITASIRQYFGTGGSPSASVDHTSSAFGLTTSWQKFTFTTTLTSISGKTLGSNDDHYLGVDFNLPLNTTQTIDIAQVKLEKGAVATAFSRAGANLAEELAMCQRYYYRVSEAPSGITFFATGFGASSVLARVLWKLPVTMRTTGGTVTISAAADFTGQDGTNRPYTALNTTYAFKECVVLDFATTCTSGNGHMAYIESGSSGWIDVDVEL